MEDYIIDSLHQDVIDFRDFAKEENKKMSSKTKYLFNMLKNDIKQVTHGEFEADIYGSFATRLSLPWSDMDIVLKPTKEYVVKNSIVLTQIEAFLKVCK